MMWKWTGRTRRSGGVLALAVVLAAAVAGLAGLGEHNGKPYRSPYDVAFSPDGKWVAVSDHTAGEVALLEPGAKQVSRRAALKGAPAGLAWSADGKRLFVAEHGAGTVAEIDAAGARVRRRFAVGRYPVPVAVVPGRGLLLVGNTGLHSVSVVDLAGGKEQARIPMVNAPRSIAVSADGSVAVVGNFLPTGDATDPKQSAAVSLIDLAGLRRTADVRLPAGSTMLRDVAISPDGRWAYAVHTVGRFTLPTTQLERGWINTNALSVIELAPAEAKPQAKGQPKPQAKGAPEKLAGPRLYATVLLDHVSEGAADPWGVALGGDGKTLWVTLAGVHQLGRVDLARLHALLAADVPAALAKQLKELARYRRAGVQVTWLEIQADPSRRRLLVNDLTAMYIAKALRRTPLPGKGPRGIALSPDGGRLAVGTYFSGEVLWVRPADGKVLATAPLGPQPKPDEVRRGETIFHDATYCFQHWLSCATCHPDGRADGLNWDLLNDGMGNPKNSKSLVWSHKTPPTMARGVRPDMETAAAAGFRFILFRVPEASEDKAVQAYLRSLAPAPSPYLAGGKLSARAERGRKLFDSRRTNCAACHPRPLLTDLKLYDVGTRGELDRTGRFDTPTLMEMWRTPPYLHDGSAATMMDVLTTRNKADQHGKTTKLSSQELEDLAEYLLSL